MHLTPRAIALGPKPNIWRRAVVSGPRDTLSPCNPGWDRRPFAWSRLWFIQNDSNEPIFFTALAHLDRSYPNMTTDTSVRFRTKHIHLLRILNHKFPQFYLSLWQTYHNFELLYYVVCSFGKHVPIINQNVPCISLSLFLNQRNTFTIMDFERYIHNCQCYCVISSREPLSTSRQLNGGMSHSVQIIVNKSR